MNSWIELGDECVEAYFVADYLIGRGYTVSVVGHGESMAPLIPDGSRMVIQPLPKSRPVGRGEAVFNRIGDWGYNVHMIADIRRKLRGTEYLITSCSKQTRFGWVPKEGILGVVTGCLENGKFVKIGGSE